MTEIEHKRLKHIDLFFEVVAFSVTLFGKYEIPAEAFEEKGFAQKSIDKRMKQHELTCTTVYHDCDHDCDNDCAGCHCGRVYDPCICTEKFCAHKCEDGTCAHSVEWYKFTDDLSDSEEEDEDDGVPAPAEKTDS